MRSRPDGRELEAGEATPLADALRAKGTEAPTVGRLAWLRSLDAALPTGTLASVFLTHVVMKGFLAGGGDEGLLFKPVEFMLAAEHVPAHRMQGLIALGAVSPWIMKPLLGAFSDMLPIFGRRRNPYIVIVTLLAFFSVSCLAFGRSQPIGAVLVCMFLASLQIAMCTLMVDAKRSEVAKQNPKLGPDLVTFTEVGMNSGLIASALVVGPLLSHAGVRSPYFVALPLVAAPLFMAWRDWLHDVPRFDDRSGPGFGVAGHNPWLFGLGCTLLPLLVLLAFGSIAGVSQFCLASCAGLASLLVVLGYSLLIRPEIAGPVVLYFCFRCLNISLTGALFYFLTDTPESYPLGPHFSPFFYASVVTTVAIAGRLVGYWTARDLFGSWHYRHTVLVTVPLCFAAQLLMVPFLGRWNRAVGVPDHAWILTCTFIDWVARGWRHYPFSVMLLQATPRGLEASTLALNTSAANMGTTLSAIFGGYLLSLLGVRPSGHAGESLHFSGLWKAQVVAAALPLLVLPLVQVCMPRRRQDEALIQTHLESATHGSPVARLLALG